MENGAQSLFDKASSLYGQGRHAEALAILDELDREHPGTRRIMFPRARCLVHLGRLDEASAICNVLVDDQGYQPAVKLRQRIASLRHEATSDDWTLEPPSAPAAGAQPQGQDFLALEVPGAPDTGVGNVMDVGMGAGLDLDPNALANLEINESFAVPVPSPDEGSEEGSHKWGGIAVVAGGVALVLLIFVGLPLLIVKLGKGSDDLPPPPPPPVEFAQESPADQQPVTDPTVDDSASAQPGPEATDPAETVPAADSSEQVVLTLINSTGIDGLNVRLNGPSKYEGLLALHEQKDLPLEPGYYSTSFSAQGVSGSFWSGEIDSPETWTFALETGPGGQQCTRTVLGAQLADAGDTMGEEGDEWSEDDEYWEDDEYYDDEYYDEGSSLFGLAWWLELIIGLAFSIVLWTINLMVTLKLTGNEKHDTFGQNFGDTVVVALGCACLTTFLNCIGLYFVVRILIANYDFGFGDFLVLIGVSFVTGLIFVGLVFLVVIVLLGAAFTAASTVVLLPVAVGALALLL